MIRTDTHAERPAYTLRRAVEALSNREISAVDMVTNALTRIAALEPQLHAWTHLDPDGATRTAGRLDRSPRKGPLHGIPLAVKDIIDVDGMPTGCGSVLREGYIAERDAWIVTWLREQGAVVLGKTVTTEFAYFRPGPTRNPRDVTRTPGGSSSGSAAAVASGMVPLALGTQTAASTIRPAAFCGVTGLVTTPGWGSTNGIAGLSHTLDSIGFIVNDAADLAVILPSRGAVSAPALLVWQPDGISDDMRMGLKYAVDRLRARGARVDVLPFEPYVTATCDDHCIIMAYEAARALATESRSGLLSAPLQQLLDDGRALSDDDVHRARSRVAEVHSWLQSHMTDHATILTPAALGVAPPGLESTGSPVLSRPWQVLGHPTVTVPALTDASRLPLGLQLVGKPQAENELVSVAVWVQDVLRST